MRYQSIITFFKVQSRIKYFFFEKKVPNFSCDAGKTFEFDMIALRYEMRKIRLELLRLVR